MLNVYLCPGADGREGARRAFARAMEDAGITAEYEALPRTAEGKPCLPDPDAPRISISHSGKWGVCALSSGEVGVDLEQIRPLRRDVARRHFTPEEQEWLSRRPPEEFFRIWTRKESFSKAMGKGLLLPMGERALLEDRITEGGKTWHFTTLSTDAGILSLCGESDVSPKLIWVEDR